MTTLYHNPFPDDPDRAAIWTMLVERDIRAFIAGDWSQVATDFPDGDDDGDFVAIDGARQANPDVWRLGFACLADYRREWLRQSDEVREAVPDLEAQLYAATSLDDIEIHRSRALAHKKFDGQLKRRDGTVAPLRWQTLYLCRKTGSRWRIQGFVGYLPNPMG
jgi:hypothetical protein